MNNLQFWDMNIVISSVPSDHSGFQPVAIGCLSSRLVAFFVIIYLCCAVLELPFSYGLCVASDTAA
jgi:hypothetical protein